MESMNNNIKKMCILMWMTRHFHKASQRDLKCRVTVLRKVESRVESIGDSKVGSTMQSTGESQRSFLIE